MGVLRFLPDMDPDASAGASRLRVVVRASRLPGWLGGLAMVAILACGCADGSRRESATPAGADGTLAIPVAPSEAAAPSGPRADAGGRPAPATRPVARRTVDLGRSRDGRPLTLIVLGRAPWPTLIIGGIHGNEPTSAAVARRLVEHLEAHPEALGHRCVAILAEANPDGLARGLRTNTALVDLNRNFPATNWAKTRKGMYFGGERVGSEPETLAVIKAFATVSPARVVSIHSMGQPCNNYDGPARALAEAMGRANGYPVKDNIGYPTPGSLGSWAGIDRRVPIVTLELPRAMPADGAWEQNRAALLAVIRAGEERAVAE